VHVVGIVHAWVVDEPLPPRHRARLLKINAHHYQQIVFVTVAEAGQAGGVVERGLRIVDGTRARDHEQPAVLAAKHRADHGPGAFYRLRFGAAERKFVKQRGRRQQRLVPENPGVPDA
jgi:hypothetical protein